MPVYIKTYQKCDKKNDIISFEVETYRQSQRKNITSKNINFVDISKRYRLLDFTIYYIRSYDMLGVNSINVN